MENEISKKPNTDLEVQSLRLAGIVRESIVDGIGIRFVVFVQGCPHKCEGCQNPQTHTFNGGTEVKIDRIINEIKKNPMIQGVTFSGGEPFCQPKGLYALGVEILKLGLNITVYSGYTFEHLCEMAKQDKYILKLLQICDVLIDGKFVKEEKDLRLRFRGSRNQRAIDLKKSFETNTTVLVDEIMNVK